MFDLFYHLSLESLYFKLNLKMEIFCQMIWIMLFARSEGVSFNCIVNFGLNCYCEQARLKNFCASARVGVDMIMLANLFFVVRIVVQI